MLLAGSTSGTLAADAAASTTCVVASTWTFTPPLGLTVQTGSGMVSYDVLCSDTSSDGVRFHGGSASGQAFTYTGNCELAIIGSGALVAHLIAGTTYVQVAGPIPRPNVVGQQAVWHLIPDQPCDEASATALGVWTEAAP